MEFDYSIKEDQNHCMLTLSYRQSFLIHLMYELSFCIERVYNVFVGLFLKIYLSWTSLYSNVIVMMYKT